MAAAGVRAVSAQRSLKGDRQRRGRADLIGGLIVTAFGAAAASLALTLERPDALPTAPGLLPFVVGLALVVLGASLTWRAARSGGAFPNLKNELSETLARGLRSDENRRAALLIAVVCAYVWLVGTVGFEFRLATGAFELEITGYELVSIVVIAAILKAFWRAGLLRCLAVALVGVEILAMAFRYGLNTILPQSF